MSPYLVSDLLENTRAHLLGMHRAELNTLKGAIGTSDTTLNFNYDMGGLTKGSFVGIDDELVYVWTTAPAQRQATVQRAMYGTTAAAHSDAAMVEVSPRFPRFAVRYGLQEEIRSWGPQVFAVKNTTLSTSTGVNGYDLGSLGSFYHILEVTRSSTSAAGQVDPHSQPRMRWRLVRKAPVSDFPSGNALILGDTFDGASGTLPTIDVKYAAPFAVDTFTDATDVLATVGLDTNWLDIPPLGAAWRLLVTREIQRSAVESQGIPMDLSQVPSGTTEQAALRLKALRDSRLNDAAIQLRAAHPVVFR